MIAPQVASEIAKGRDAEKSGRLAEALSCYRQALTIAPGHGQARQLCSGVLVRIGRAHQAAGRLQAAADALDAALMLDDRNLAVALQLARVLMMLVNFPAARHVLAHAERIGPDERSVFALQGELASATGDWAELERSSLKLADASAGDPAPWRAIANARAAQGLYKAALEAMETAVAKAGSRSGDLVDLARIALQALNFPRAEKALAEAEANAPNAPAVLAAKAMLLTYQGRTQEAEDYCMRCIAIDSRFVQAYPQLSVLRKGRLSSNEEEPLWGIARDETAPPAARTTASFVLAHSLDARNETDLAFAEYERANELSAARAKAEGYVFDAEGADAWTTHIINTFKGESAGLQSSSPTPLFIVGLPRSGSTLIESVLGAHSNVVSAGEAPMLPPLFNAWVKARGLKNNGVLTDDERLRAAENYLRGAPADAEFFTDKNLLNIEAVGFAAQVFPSARFINIRRNPLECGLAIYRRDFLKFWTFSTSLQNIGRRYSQYARLVAHWERAYPERFETIQYETFTDQFDTEARRLIDFCGLEWEDACRNFQNVERIAATISAAQVREPVRRASGRLEAYEKHLEPLRAALEGGGVDLNTGALKAQT